MITEIIQYQDWYTVQNEIQSMISGRTEFMGDYSRLCKNIEIKLRDLGNIEIQLKKKESLYHTQLRDEKLKEINQTIRAFSKILLMASLTKR